MRSNGFGNITGQSPLLHVLRLDAPRAHPASMDESMATVITSPVIIHPPCFRTPYVQLALCQCRLNREQRSIAHREPLPDMLSFLHFIDHRHRIILDRDPTLSVRILQQLISPESEFSGSLAGGQVG